MFEFILKRQNKIITINKLYTILLISFPILFLYRIGFSTVTFGDFLLLLFNFIFLLRSFLGEKNSFFPNLLPFFIYIIIITFFSDISIETLFRTLRYIFYLFNIIFLVKSHFDYVFGIKIYRFISLLSTLFLYIQIFFYKIFGLYIPGVILNINIIPPDLYNYESVFYSAQVKRFMSFFEEPSHFAIYILGYITILLFFKKKNSKIKKSFIFELLFLSIGIVLSTSILGFLVLIALFCIWFINFLFNTKKNFIKILFLILVLILGIVLISQTTAFNYITNLEIIDKQGGGRFRGYRLLFNLNNSKYILNIFGRGMVNVDYNFYLASYPLMVYYFGFVGLFLFIMAFIPYFKNIQLNISTSLLICVFGISLGSEILLGRFILVFLPLIIKKLNYANYNMNIKKCNGP